MDIKEKIFKEKRTIAIGIISMILLVILFQSFNKANNLRKYYQYQASNVTQGIKSMEKEIKSYKSKVNNAEKKKKELTEKLESETKNNEKKQQEYADLKVDIDNLLIERSELVEKNIQEYKVDAKNQLTKEESVKALGIVKGSTVDPQAYKIVVGKDSTRTNVENIGNMSNSNETYSFIKNGIYVVVAKKAEELAISHVYVVDMINETVAVDKAYDNLQLGY